MIKKIIYKSKWVLIRPRAFDMWRKISHSEFESRDVLCQSRENALRNIVSQAMQNTRFYCDLYKSSGFEIGDMQQNGWFERLPIVSKQALREHFEEFINHKLRKYLRISTTGGSTGTPIKTGYDGRIPEEVYSWRLQGWFCVNPWDDHAYVWRDTRSSRLAKLKNAALWWPTRHLKMDATFITEEGMCRFVRRYNAIRPAMLQGYVGAITQLAQFVVDNHIDVWTPKFVWVTSAPLPTMQRNLIARAFGAPVCDQYGSCEIRWIAAQCPACKGLHVNTEHVHIEFVDDGNRPVPKGAYGRTLLTNLEDTAFPLIRYENNDRGRWLTSACECGRTLPCIDAVKGREVESFTLPDGKTINGEYLTTIFDATPDIALGFRVVQHKDLSITVECIPSTTESRGKISEVVRNFRDRLGGMVPVDCKFVGAIPHDRGKLRFVVKEN